MQKSKRKNKKKRIEDWRKRKKRERRKKERNWERTIAATKILKNKLSNLLKKRKLKLSSL